MFTVFFAIGRLPGWIAHRREQNSTPGMLIAWPRQVYVGRDPADDVPLGERG